MLLLERKTAYRFLGVLKLFYKSDGGRRMRSGLRMQSMASSAHEKVEKRQVWSSRNVPSVINARRRDLFDSGGRQMLGWSVVVLRFEQNRQNRRENTRYPTSKYAISTPKHRHPPAHTPSRPSGLENDKKFQSKEFINVTRSLPLVNESTLPLNGCKRWFTTK